MRWLVLSLVLLLASTVPTHRPKPANPDLTPAIHQMIESGLERGPVEHHY